MGKGLVPLLSFFFVALPTLAGEPSALPVRILLDQSPSTLNPRATLDAAGQRVNALLFRGLTRIDADLNPQPDLAEKWQVLDAGRLWKFTIPPNLRDHAGQPIDADKIAACLENYRIGKPTSPLRGSFPAWESTVASRDSVVIRLKASDPYLARNLSLLRYFRTESASSPCEEPHNSRSLIGSGLYRAEKWDLSPEDRFLILPAELAGDRSPIEFHFVHDDNTKSLKLLRGEVDAIQNALSLTKTRWIQRKYAARFNVLERNGVAVSYLAFNFRDPTLARREVRQAISEALDRESIVRNKLLGFAEVAGSFLSPLLPESLQARFTYDPAHAEKLLEQAGFPRDKSGIRLRLHYKTTPAREGIETALLFQDMLRRIGIKLIIDVVEPAVFFASVRKGAFQLYSSRWLGVADGSILYNSLHTGQPQNRIGYSNPAMDELLERAIAQPDLDKRLPILHEIQRKMADEFLYFPLWYWNSALIVRKGLGGLKSSELSLSGALEPLTHLR